MVQTGNALWFIVFGRFCFPAVLQSLRKGLTSTILSISSQLVSIIGFSFILFYTDKHNPIRICWCYHLSYAFGLVVGAIVIIPSMIKIWKDFKKMHREVIPVSTQNVTVTEEEENDKSHNSPVKYKENEMTEL